MDDLISRKAAIDALGYAQHRFTVADEAGGMGTVKWSEDVIYFAAAERILTELPSAQRTGRWIIKEIPGIEWYRVTCSACGEDVSSVVPTIGFFPNVKALWDFCPECGARMEVEDND